MLDERNNRLSCSSSRPAPTTLAAHSGVLGLLRSAGKTAPQIAAAVHQAVCTRRALHPRCNSLRSGEAVASTADEPSAGSPQLQWWAAGRGPAPNVSQPHASLVFLGVGWAEAPVVVRFFFHVYNLSKRFNTLCRKRSGRTPGIRRSAKHAGLAGMAADASGPPQHELLKVGALWTPCCGQLAQGSALAAMSALPGLAVTHSDNTRRWVLLSHITLCCALFSGWSQRYFSSRKTRFRKYPKRPSRPPTCPARYGRHVFDTGHRRAGPPPQASVGELLTMASAGASQPAQLRC